MRYFCSLIVVLFFYPARSAADKVTDGASLSLGTDANAAAQISIGESGDTGTLNVEKNASADLTSNVIVGFSGAAGSADTWSSGSYANIIMQTEDGVVTIAEDACVSIVFGGDTVFDASLANPDNDNRIE